MIDWKSFKGNIPEDSGKYLLAVHELNFFGEDDYNIKTYNYDTTCNMFYDIENISYGYFKPKDSWYWCKINKPNEELV